MRLKLTMAALDAAVSVQRLAKIRPFTQLIFPLRPTIG
jgi:hypothetical protein